MLCHAIGHQLLPTHCFTVSATDLRVLLILRRFFTLHSLLVILGLLRELAFESQDKQGFMLIYGTVPPQPFV